MAAIFALEHCITTNLSCNVYEMKIGGIVLQFDLVYFLSLGEGFLR